MSKSYGQTGVASDVELGKAGPRLNNSSGVVQHLTVGGAFARAQGADSVVDDDFVTKRQFDAGGGSLAGLPGVPLNNLLAYVDIGDRNSYPGTGATVTDLLGNLTSGTIAGATFENGTLEFDGSSGDLTFTKPAALDNIFSGGGSVMVFFRAFDDGEGSLGRLFSTSGYSLYVANRSTSGDSDTIRVLFTRDFSTADGIWASDDVDGSIRIAETFGWHSFAVLYDDTGDPTFYLDGRFISLNESTTPVGSVVSDVGSDVVVGNIAADTRTFNGQIDVALMFDAVISGSEISQLHSAFIARHNTTGAPGTGAIGGAATSYYGGDYLGTANTNAGDMDFEAGRSASSNTASKGGRFRARSGSSVGGPHGEMICTGGEGGQSRACEFGGGTVHSGSGGAETLFRGTDNTATGAAGDSKFRGGDCTDDGSGSDTGGACGIRGGTSRNTGPAGQMVVRSGGPSTGTSGSTADLELTTRATNDIAGLFGTFGGIFTDTGNISISTDGAGSGANVCGDITVTGGTPGASSGNSPGAVTIICGSITSATQNSQGGAPFKAVAGSSNGNINSPGASATLQAGDQTNASSASDGGHAELIAGTVAGTGVPGAIRVDTNGVVNPLEIRTVEVQTVDSAANQDFLLATLPSDGDFASVTVEIDAQDDAGGADFYSRAINTAFYRTGGTVTEIATRHLNSTVTVGLGSTYSGDIVFSGDDILLRLIGPSSGTVNFSATASTKPRIT